MQAIDLKVGDVFMKIGYAEHETIETSRTFFGSTSHVFVRGDVFTVLESSWDLDTICQNLIVQTSDGSRRRIKFTSNSPFNTLFDHFFKTL